MSSNETMEVSSEVASSSGGKNGGVTSEGEHLSMEKVAIENGNTVNTSMSTELAIIADYKSLHDQLAQVKAQLASAQKTIAEKDVETARQKTRLEESEQEEEEKEDNGGRERDPENMKRIMRSNLKTETNEEMAVQITIGEFNVIIRNGGEKNSTGMDLLKEIVEYVEEFVKNDEDKLIEFQERQQRYAAFMMGVELSKRGKLKEFLGLGTSSAKTEEEPELVPTQSVEVEPTVTVAPEKHAIIIGNSKGQGNKRKKI